MQEKSLTLKAQKGAAKMQSARSIGRAVLPCRSKLLLAIGRLNRKQELAPETGGLSVSALGFSFDVRCSMFDVLL